MPLQYLSDTVGNHTAVLIPIGEWEILTSKYKDLKQLEMVNIDSDLKSGRNNVVKKQLDIEQPATINNAAKFKGIFSKAEGEKFNQHIDQARKEWDRSF